jgi:CD109 antigen
MKSKVAIFVSFALILGLLSASLPACQPVFSAEAHMVIVPRILYSGETTELSVALLKGDEFRSGDVEVTLVKEGKIVVRTESHIDGKGIIELKLPQLDSGTYEIQVSGPGFSEKANIKVESSFLLFLETDKPIYKPGQTIHISTISLNSELRPISQQITIYAQDAKGTKVYKKDVTTDRFGMASIELPLSTEPNLGVWKIVAEAQDSKTQIDVRVEEYVLPKYEVKVNLPKDWFLVSDRISGAVEGIYSFGKPVSGELEIIASRYVGEWQEYARLTKTINGTADFELPAVEYVAGVPASGGMGNVNIEFVIREQSTGYEERTTRLLTIAASPLSLQIIPEGNVFKPGLPFNFLLLSENPGRQPVPATVDVTVSYLDKDYDEIDKEKTTIDTGQGMVTVLVSPQAKSVAMVIEATSDGAHTSQIILATYSPTGSFIHLEQVSDPLLAVGETARFKIHATKEATTFYYEVIASGRVVFSDFTRSQDIIFNVTPQMAGSARLLVYQILPNSEVAADYLPFNVSAIYPNQVSAVFNTEESRPGDTIEVNVQSEGLSKVGLVIVDKSVFILAENRMNLEQVFAELERLYMTPQAELHSITLYPAITTKGASDIMRDAGVIVLSNKRLPEGKEFQSPWGDLLAGGDLFLNDAVREEAVLPGVDQKVDTSDLVQVERIRQFFPETWVWQQLETDSSGKANLTLTVPDSVTTWMLRAVAISEYQGLGIAEDELRAFQPFFIKLDLPYSAIRGEEFPVRVAVYNYLDEAQDIVVELKATDWFELLDDSQKTIEVAAGDVGSVNFKISPKGLGFNNLQVSARSKEVADALILPLLVQPEGVPREFVENLILNENSDATINTTIPEGTIAESGRVFLSLTGSYLTQTLEGLEGLIQMPFGCGEQNMIVFAPDVFITRYLEESGQLKVEIMAKAEKLMITGYQRELTYRRSDGSFSAFGNQDESGSLWLTAFVLKSFAQAKNLIFVDQDVLDAASDWIIKHQKEDGSFESVGFVHHQEMMGGLTGKDALTAYVAIALIESDEEVASAQAIGYLESRLQSMDDPYTMAISSYALELAGSAQRDAAYDMLMAIAKEDDNGLHWGNGGILELQPVPDREIDGRLIPPQNPPAIIETTSYAMLALINHGDSFNAGRAGKWLVSQRNAYGGYGSTQDTVVALQALTEYATNLKSDVNLEVHVIGRGIDQVIYVNPSNFDVMQIIELPTDSEINITASGQGEVITQVVTRFNIDTPDEADPVIKVDVMYDASEVLVNDLVNVTASVGFNPPEPIASGMVVLDISVPTGFAPVVESIEAAVAGDPVIKRFDISGRKVIFYLDEIKAGETITLTFQVKAVYPVKAKGVVSQAYAYYQPDLRGESLSQEFIVS